MQPYLGALDWLGSQQDNMTQTLIRWANINSGSENLTGLATMTTELEHAFAPLGANVATLPTPTRQIVNAKGELEQQALGDMLSLRQRPDAPVRILLCGHMDTVFGADHEFQVCRHLDDQTINGPGVTDMKGGLLVMLYGLMALEQFTLKDNIGWEVLINADEELGSPGSAKMLETVAKRNTVGFAFEPATNADGTLAGQRKGSGKFTVVCRGRAAHAGRHFAKGRNAIVALSQCITELASLNGQRDGVTINIGHIHGGGPINVVPDLAQCSIDVRLPSKDDEAWVQDNFNKVIATHQQHDGIEFALHGGFGRQAKHITGKTKRLYEQVVATAGELGMALDWQATGGCCDGNNLAAAGLPNVDTLGVRGGNIHSSDEYIILPSLVERAQLHALLLMKFAAGELSL